jgi:glycogen synthase
MKLLFYSHFFAPSIGGVETIVKSLACGLSELRSVAGTREFEITLVTQTPVKDFDDNSLPFRIVRQPGFARLWRLILSADVIHVAGPALVPLLLGFLARRPVVVEHHGFQSICPNGQMLIESSATPCPGHFMLHHHGDCIRCNSKEDWLRSVRLWFLTFLRRWFCRRAAANISPTAWLGNLIHLPSVKTIPHGIEGRAAVRQPQMSKSPRLIAFQGRLVNTKGVRVLLEAAKILWGKNQAFQLVIIGDGSERQTLEELAQQWQLETSVRFMGKLGSTEAEAVLSQAFAVVVPSIGGEVFGLVVVENMQRGIPVVASDLGALVEVIGNCGVTFRTGDAVSLAETLSELMDRPEHASDLGRTGSRRVEEEFGLERMICAHADVYRSILPK